MASRLPALLQRADHDLFVPITFALSRRLEQIEWDELVEDRGLAVFTVHSSLRTFSADGVVNWFDSWLEAESAGARCERGADGRVTRPAEPLAVVPDAEAIVKGRSVSAALDIASRLCQQTGERGLVLGYITGPVTLHHRLYGADRKADAASLELCAKVATSMARAYCDAGISALLIAEEEPAGDPAAVEALAPLFNLAEYYGAPVVYLSRSPAPAPVAESLKRLGAWIADAEGAAGGVVAIPLGEANAAACAQAWRAAAAGGVRRMVLSNWDIPADTPPEDVIGLAQQIGTN